MPLAIGKLRPNITQCILSRAIQTEPVGIVSDRKFLNMIAYLESDLDPTALKAFFNRIEAELGRDRSDPLRKVKDRTIDLDILGEVRTEEDWFKMMIEVPDYCRLIFLELFVSLPNHVSSLERVTLPLQIGALQCGHQPISLPL